MEDGAAAAALDGKEGAPPPPTRADPRPHTADPSPHGAAEAPAAREHPARRRRPGGAAAVGVARARPRPGAGAALREEHGEGEAGAPSLLAACARLGRAGAALHGMALKLGLAGDAYVRNAAIAMYASCARTDEALALLGRCPEFDAVACNSAIVALARAGRVDEARAVFDGMPDRTVATWSAMVSAYARAARCGEALSLFSAMQAGGVEPNAHVLVTVLGCCAASARWTKARAWVHAYIDRHGVAMNALVVTALVDMYCKCGSVDDARQVFDAARSHGSAKLSSWNVRVHTI